MCHMKQLLLQRCWRKSQMCNWSESKLTGSVLMFSFSWSRVQLLGISLKIRLLCTLTSPKSELTAFTAPVTFCRSTCMFCCWFQNWSLQRILNFIRQFDQSLITQSVKKNASSFSTASGLLSLKTKLNDVLSHANQEIVASLKPITVTDEDGQTVRARAESHSLHDNLLCTKSTIQFPVYVSLQKEKTRTNDLRMKDPCAETACCG